MRNLIISLFFMIGSFFGMAAEKWTEGQWTLASTDKKTGFLKIKDCTSGACAIQVAVVVPGGHDCSAEGSFSQSSSIIQFSDSTFPECSLSLNRNGKKLKISSECTALCGEGVSFTGEFTLTKKRRVSN